MYTLGINAAYHDSAACLVRDGQVLAAAEEERFTRVKHGKRPTPFSAYELPFAAMDYCLAEAGITLLEVDHVAYSYDPYLLLDASEGRRQSTDVAERAMDAFIRLPLEPSAHVPMDGWDSVWDPLFVSSIVNAPRHLVGGVPHHLRKRLLPARPSGDGARSASSRPYLWHFVEHHTAHAASAFFPSPFDRAAILTIDGRGELATTTYSLGQGAYISRLGEVDMPHSLGFLYERITEHLGFLHSSDEYKVMALASYGTPRFLLDFRELIQLGSDGSYEIGPTSPDDLVARFGPRRFKGERFSQVHFDIAHSLQAALEESVVHLADWLQRRTDADSLCLAGGVALNCVLNSRLRDETKFRSVWVQPAASDSGTALGAALLVDARERKADGRKYEMVDAYLGPGFSDEAIEIALTSSKVKYRRPGHLADTVADLLAASQVVGWFQGRMEFGPRALGSRSILASPVEEHMRDKLNEIKDREDFRPVAPVVLEEAAADWFVDARRSPFMLFVNQVRPEVAGRIPAVRHIDGTARIQTVSVVDNPQLHDVIAAFARRTGVPVLINTSFNTLGEPIVCTPRDALECFWTSPIDALVIGPFLLQKRAIAQTARASRDGHSRSGSSS